MRFDQRIVIHLLREIWNDEGVLSTREVRYLNGSDIGELLRLGKVRFVIADAGVPLKWIPAGECYEFWKAEVKNHLASPGADNDMEAFADGYFYFASQWESEQGEPIVLLAKYH